MKVICALFPLVLAAHAGEFAITHVTAVDVQQGRAIRGVTVVVSGDRIRAVGPSGRVKPVRGAQVIDGRGRFLIPGLWDMHVHMRSTWDIHAADPAPRDFYSPHFLANGITGVRSMWDSFDALKELRAGTAAAPRVIASGNMLDGEQPSLYGAIACATPAQGRAEVRKLEAEGVDFIKVYSRLSRETYLAIADEARKAGLPFAGHVPNAMSVAEASDAGQKSVEHLLGVFAACSSREREFAGDANYAKFGAPLRAAAESFDEAKAAALFAKFVRNGTRHCPTLTVLRAAAFAGDSELMKEDRIGLLPPLVQRLWKMGGAGLDPADPPAARKRQFERELKLTGAMHRAGVKILAGTDTPNPYVFPGSSLHDELALMVEAGLTPAQALAAATIRPAEYLGIADRLGAIAAGKLADMVLLDADPLADVANTRRIRAVVVNGALYLRPELDRMLARRAAQDAGN